MTDAEKIAALAAELTRINKLPQWIGSGPKNTWAIFEDGTNETVLREDAVLAALSGVAAEVLAHYQGLEASIRKLSLEDGYSLYTNQSYKFYPTYPEALVAALKQIESEVKNG